MLIRTYSIIYITFILGITFAHSEESNLGSFRITSTAADLLGPEQAKPFEELIDIEDNITWEVHVPATYDPENPPGILVYISPQDIINIPSGWLDMMEEHNLIWIASLKSGNEVFTSERLMKAILGLVQIQSEYVVDTERIYITGFSGGGRVASIVATQYPHLFKGAIYNCGANFWENLDDERKQQVLNNRFVFVTGSNDFNLQDTKNVYSKYKKAGAKNIELMVINRLGHANPKRNRMSQAIRFLDDK